MFYKKFDEISSKIPKIFNNRKGLYEAAKEYADLATTQDEQNPFECGLVALAIFGEMQCYKKLDDKQKTVRTAVKAARLFIKSATFNYEISRNLRDTWSDPLADGLHCYRVAADVLKSQGKHNLAVVLLIELGKTEAQFDLFHYAGNTYEEALTLCIDQTLSPPLLFDSTFYCIDCYNRADRLDLGLSVVDRVFSKIPQALLDQVRTSPLMNRQFSDLQIFKAQLLLSAFRHAECIEYSAANLDEKVASIFSSLCEASKSNQIAVIDALINDAKAQNYFTEQHIALFERHLFLLSKSIETAYSELAH
ncbi:hypothetical protein GPJ56_007359 [Histomonas meleagridis]|uniref:uncharacterized protein n=1 Tax=Histomonas meleagridis TaxID=135588 RepID=UPI0035595AAF|nr:hypothetical protein GPJ56_007359 [Histomonas meleagridis]KAH0804205.1 hypothetical protein GO595_003035 [Histomonas meleagridis]